MKIKQVEIRDRATCIPALALEISAADGFVFRRAGFGPEPYILLIHLENGRAEYDAYKWNNRTMGQAHKFINENFNSLSDDCLVDVEFILGESATPKNSERINEHF